MHQRVSLIQPFQSPFIYIYGRDATFDGKYDRRVYVSVRVCAFECACCVAHAIWNRQIEEHVRQQKKHIGGKPNYNRE